MFFFSIDLDDTKNQYFKAFYRSYQFEAKLADKFCTGKTTPIESCLRQVYLMISHYML